MQDRTVKLCVFSVLVSLVVLIFLFIAMFAPMGISPQAYEEYGDSAATLTIQLYVCIAPKCFALSFWTLVGLIILFVLLRFKSHAIKTFVSGFLWIGLAWVRAVTVLSIIILLGTFFMRQNGVIPLPPFLLNWARNGLRMLFGATLIQQTLIMFTLAALQKEPAFAGKKYL